jgi:predicted XRE-type DNA-binding protein
MPINPSACMQALRQRLYTDRSIDPCSSWLKNASFFTLKKELGMAKKHWILVANASQARFFERTSFTQPLLELTD